MPIRSLGAGSAAFTASEASAVADLINNAFLNGTPSTFAQEHLVNGACPTYYRDADGDGYGDPLAPSYSGPAGYVTNNSDCDDTDPVIHPGVPDQTCNGVDNDCDGTVDDAVSGCTCVENSPGLAGWWRGNGNANDAAAGNHGTLVNGATASAAGRVGQAFSLDGVDDYVAGLGDVYSYAFIQNTGVFTINAWIHLDDVTALRGDQAITSTTPNLTESGHLFTWYNPAGEQCLELWLMKSIGGDQVIHSRSPFQVITTNGWHHVAAVGNGTTVTFYVDGVGYLGTGTMTSKPNGPSSNVLNIGRCPYVSPVCQFAGEIDEVQIHDRALSASEIRAIYNAGGNGMCGTGCAQSLAGLVGWWPGGGDAGDRSPANNNGSLAGAVSFAAGKVGQAFSFPGNATAYVGLPNAASLRVSSGFTTAAWIRTNDPGAYQQIISLWSLSAGDYAYQMYIFSPGSLRLDVSQNGSAYDAIVSPAGVLSAGAWKHVAATFNSGLCKLYVDGALVWTQSSLVTSIFAGTGAVGPYLGVGNGNVQRFNGLIDEPMVFNRALSAEEITTLYQAGASGLCGLGLVVSVEEPTRPEGSLAFSAPWPNPSTRQIQMRLQLPAGALVRAEVFDIAGRRVTSLVDEQRLPAGEHQLTWDGRDASGARVAAGVYQIRVRADDELAVRRIVMIR